MNFEVGDPGFKLTMVPKVTIKMISLLIFQTIIALGSSGYTQENTGNQNNLDPDRSIKIATIDSMNKVAFAVFRTDPAQTRRLALQALKMQKL